LATVEVLQLAGTLRTFIKYAAYSLLVWALVKVVLDMVFLGLHQRRMRRRVINPDFTPSVAVIVPAYNEAESIGDALRTIAASDYPIREIVVVDDGSKDGTAQIARDLGIPNVTVIEQTNAGKAAALNRGVREATAEIVVCVDADTVFQADTVTWIVQPFIDPAVGAVSGNVKVGNRRSLLGKWQHVEYSYGQQTERRAQEMLRVTWCIPGAIGAFRRIALLEAGGFTTDTMAEDTDTAVQVHLEGWGSVFEPRSIAWTEVPTNVRALWRQRMRWHFGNYQVLWKQRAQVFKRPRRFGLLMMPYSFISLVAMPLALPIIDVLALVQIIVNGPGTVVYLWILLGGLTALSAVIALRTNGERIRSIVHLPMQQIVYRWAYIVLSLKALYMALSSSLVAWNKPARRGEAGAALFATTAKHGAESTVIDLTRPVVGATVVEVADGNTENELRAP
ncbi:MAG TPA: glycosyltransferase, partial [Acidimicrobiales bacterium]